MALQTMRILAVLACARQAAAANGQFQDPTRTSATGAFFRSMLRRGVSGALAATDASSGAHEKELLRRALQHHCEARGRQAVVYSCSKSIPLQSDWTLHADPTHSRVHSDRRKNAAICCSNR